MKARIDNNRVAELIAKLNAVASAMMLVHSSYGSTSPVREETIALLLEETNTLVVYYMLKVLDATKETAPILIQLLLQLADQLRQCGDPFYAGFFVALVDLLDVKFEVGAFGEKIDKQKFEQQLTQTIEKYGLEAEELEDKRELNRNTSPTGYVV